MMRTTFLLSLCLAGVLPAADVLGPEEVPATAPADSTTIAKRRPADPALWPVTPTAGYGGWSKATGSTWLGIEAKLEVAAAARSSAEILMLGDAIPAALGHGLDAEPAPPATWTSLMGTKQALNLAQPGETTEQILWRLEHGLASTLTPQVVVVGVGANNLVAVERQGVPVTAVAKGIEAVVEAVRSRWPKARVVVIEPLLMGRPTPVQREHLKTLHAAMAAWPPTPGVTVVDPRKDLADEAGVIRADRSGYGGLRLNDAGREALVAALAATMKGQP
jgi:lysophospholipase L1-like esterase